MFLVSGPALVTETCKAGVAGTFPALNARTRKSSTPGWARSTRPWPPPHRRSGGAVAPYGVNLILHASNPRVAPDLELICKHGCPS
jgi:nitronate monooxygenase